MSVLILLFWGFFIIAHSFGDEGFAPGPLNASDYVGLIAMAAWLLGLAVAWKKEFIGGLITLIAFAISAVNDSIVLLFPFLLVPITAVCSLWGGGCAECAWATQPPRVRAVKRMHRALT